MRWGPSPPPRRTGHGPRSHGPRSTRRCYSTSARPLPCLCAPQSLTARWPAGHIGLEPLRQEAHQQNSTPPYMSAVQAVRHHCQYGTTTSSSTTAASAFASRVRRKAHGVHMVHEVCRVPRCRRRRQQASSGPCKDVCGCSRFASGSVPVVRACSIAHGSCSCLCAAAGWAL